MSNGRKWIKTADYFRQASASITAGSNTDLISEAVPNFLTLRVTAIGTYVGTAAAWGYMTWNVNYNGSPMYPYGNIMDQMGLQNEPIPIMPIELSPCSRFSVNCANGAGVTHVGGIVIRGEWGYYE